MAGPAWSLEKGSDRIMVMRRFFAIVVAGLFAAASVVLAGTPAGAAEWWLQYSDRGSRQCLEVSVGSHPDGVAVVQSPCKVPVGSGADHQRFQLARLDNGNYFVIAKHSNKCLQNDPDVVVGPPAVEQATCRSGTERISQEWQTPAVRQNPNGSVDIMFRNVHTGKCMSSSSGAVGLVVTQESCNSADPRQVWRQHLREGGGRS
jgi:hypothetical protein